MNVTNTGTMWRGKAFETSDWIEAAETLSCEGFKTMAALVNIGFKNMEKAVSPASSAWRRARRTEDSRHFFAELVVRDRYDRGGQDAVVSVDDVLDGHGSDWSSGIVRQDSQCL